MALYVVMRTRMVRDLQCWPGVTGRLLLGAKVCGRPDGGNDAGYPARHCAHSYILPDECRLLLHRGSRMGVLPTSPAASYLEMAVLCRSPPAIPGSVFMRSSAFVRSTKPTWSSREHARECACTHTHTHTSSLIVPRDKLPKPRDRDSWGTAAGGQGPLVQGNQCYLPVTFCLKCKQHKQCAFLPLFSPPGVEPFTVAGLRASQQGLRCPHGEALLRPATSCSESVPLAGGVH